MIPFKLRRSLSIVIPLFSALLFFGVLTSMLDIELSTNIANTGLTISFIFGILNLFLLYLAGKHLVP